MGAKLSFRFYGDHEVRAVWDEAEKQWWFAVVDVVAAVSGSKDPRNYWYVLKNRLRKVGNEPLTKCKGFKLVAPDGKRRLTDCIDSRELFMKGIDYSYYYESDDVALEPPPRTV